MIFTGGCKFSIVRFDEHYTITRKKYEGLKSENLYSTVKHHGDSVIVWGCMSAVGVGSLQIINKTSNHRIYIDILKCNLLSSAERMGIKDDFVSHDNNPGHTVYNIRMWTLHNTPAYLKTPPKSPDINPIEQLWDYLVRQLRKYKISLK